MEGTAIEMAAGDNKAISVAKTPPPDEEEEEEEEEEADVGSAEGPVCVMGDFILSLLLLLLSKPRLLFLSFGVSLKFMFAVVVL